MNFVSAFFCFLAISVSAMAKTAELPTLSLTDGEHLTARCAWAPNDASVCRARAACPHDVHSAKCAKYCKVNPYDVVCGYAYRHPAMPYRVQPPYPWADERPFCVEHYYLQICQDYPWAY